ncbi:ATP-binding protein [Candidatus Dependentiae bacterium]
MNKKYIAFTLLTLISFNLLKETVSCMTPETVAMTGMMISKQEIDKIMAQCKEMRKKCSSLEATLHGTKNPKKRLKLQSQIKALELEIDCTKIQIPHVGIGLVEAGKVFAQAQIDKARAVGDQKTAAIKAAIASQTIVNGITQFLSNPQTILMISGIIFGCYYGGKTVQEFIRKNLFKPKVIEETSILSGMDKVRSVVQKKKAPVSDRKIDEIIATKDMKDRILEIAKTLRTARKVGEDMPNVLLYGPPGTGKTMTARILASISGLDYMVIPGPALTKLAKGEDIRELDRIFSMAKKSKKGTLIFFDEAESFLANRENLGTSERSKQLTQTFLTKVPKPSDKNIVFVFATNRRNVLDPAIESRISEVLHISSPGEAEKLQLLNLYLNKEVVKAGIKLDREFIEQKSNLVKTMDEKMCGRDLEELTKQLRRKVRLAEKTSLSIGIAKSVISEVNKKLATQRLRQTSLS